MTATGCTPACWTPAPCPGCGSQLPPRGRSVPRETGIAGCCDEARMNPAVNPRHLWRENEDAERCEVCGDDAEAECAACERPLCGDHRRATSVPGDSFCQPGTGCQA